MQWNKYVGPSKAILKSLNKRDSREGIFLPFLLCTNMLNTGESCCTARLTLIYLFFAYISFYSHMFTLLHADTSLGPIYDFLSLSSCCTKLLFMSPGRYTLLIHDVSGECQA